MKIAGLTECNATPSLISIFLENFAWVTLRRYLYINMGYGYIEWLITLLMRYCIFYIHRRNILCDINHSITRYIRMGEGDDGQTMHTYVMCEGKKADQHICKTIFVGIGTGYSIIIASYSVLRRHCQYRVQTILGFGLRLCRTHRGVHLSTDDMKNHH